MTEPRKIAFIKSYDELMQAFRSRADELQLTRLGLDAAMATLPDGYASKLLAPVPIRVLGRVSLGPMLQALGMAIVLVEDLTALQRITSQIEKRERPVYNASDTMRPNPRRRKSKLVGNSEWSKLMNARRILLLSDAKRSRIARKAARIRWRDVKMQPNTP